MLFTTDVSARGMDYSDVALVVQVGAPLSRRAYVHRIGRTGRSGRKGSALLLLYDFEVRALNLLDDLPLKLSRTSAAYEAAMPRVNRTADLQFAAELAYDGWLTQYSSRRTRGNMTDAELVENARRFAASIDAVADDGTTPELLEEKVRKLDLLHVPGLHVVKEFSRHIRQ
eukprot:TRINITY_DN38834_c0_g1_i2.p1 TRINITY_DN38834_c0_g1~~TRINITY_DN38834_c0_g1_i2.p1  ORF type:complete len:199 (-),score=19.94 TRINITY_DN38834_c0_g1_i2:269-781(-)